MLFQVTCAFVNSSGCIEMHTNTFAAKDANAVKEQARDYFTETFCHGRDYIYSNPLDVSTEKKKYNTSNISINGRNVQIGKTSMTDMVQINHGSARGVQVNGNPSGVTIITGDSNISRTLDDDGDLVKGNIVKGDKVCLDRITSDLFIGDISLVIE
jgi:hypothetical protein